MNKHANWCGCGVATNESPPRAVWIDLPIAGRFATEEERARYPTGATLHRAIPLDGGGHRALFSLPVAGCTCGAGD